jgi:1,4-dihydroxy-2-naphthoyl-CoA hydrolase
VAFRHDHVVRFRETDAAGVLYFANLLALCHDAYEASLAIATLDLRSFFAPAALAVPIVHAEADFRQPLYCGDHLTIHGQPHRHSDSTFSIQYEVEKRGQGIAAIAQTRHCCIDTATRRRHPLPEALVQWLSLTGGMEPF